MEENFFNMQRASLSPRESMKKLSEYALQADARKRMRLGGLAKGNILATGLITIPPFLYMTYVIDGALFGCHQGLSPNFSIFHTLLYINKDVRQNFRPEIYLRDRTLDVLEKDRRNLGQGEETNTLQLWH